ncbi:MAG TPA: restriction endonuclease subunit S [Spirochaetales bacterium]|nr:restriction endonuclease subunit S [Spirochaetales bacterium]HRY53453.1 restriction endonuclease subunit S [Spirochaetia bacterium]
MNTLLKNFDLVAASPEGIAQLRKYILELAVRGKLVPQDTSEEPASVLLEKIKAEKARLVKEGKIKAPKELPEIGEEEKPYELPRGWEWVRLGEISNYIQRGKGPEYVPQSSISVINQKCVRWGGIDLGPARFISEQSFNGYDEERILQDGDILWNSTGTGTIGRACVFASELHGSFVCDSHVTIVRLSRVLPHYVLIWLRSPNIYDQIESNANGSTNQIELATSTVISTQVPLPPLAEQSRIVSRVQELMAVLDRLEARSKEAEAGRSRALVTLSTSLSRAGSSAEQKQKWRLLSSSFDSLVSRAEDVKALRSLVLELAVRGKLVPQDKGDEPASILLEKIKAEKARLVKAGKIKAPKELPEIGEEEKPYELPVGWEWVRLGAIASQITKGSTPTTYGFQYETNGINFIKVENIEKNYVIRNSITQFISLEAHESFKRSQLEDGDVLFSIAGTIGEICKITPDILPANVNQALAIIRGTVKCCTQDYLILCLNSFVSEQVSRRARGGAMNNVSLGDLIELCMPIPPLAEQARIVVRVQELMAVLDRLEGKLGAKEEAGRKYAKAAVAL